MTIFKLDSYSTEGSANNSQGSGNSPTDNTTVAANATDTGNLAELTDVEIPATARDAPGFVHPFARYVDGGKEYHDLLVVAFVAAGGCGSVFRAMCGGEVYAVKAQLTGEDKKDNVMFWSEEGVMERMKGLPNVVQMRGAFGQLNHLLLVLDWKAPRPIIAAVKKAMRGFVAGLTQIHQLRIVHCDIKPEIILLSDLDTSFWRTLGWLGPSSTMTASCGEDMGYQADEMLVDKPYDTKADIFSTGIALKLMLGYSRKEEDDAEVKGQLELGHSLANNLIAELPEHRFSAEEAELHPFLAEIGPEDPDLMQAGEGAQEAEEGAVMAEEGDAARAAARAAVVAGLHAMGSKTPGGSLPAGVAFKDATTLPLPRRCQPASAPARAFV